VLRVFIADDSLGFGTLAAAWLEAHPDIEVVGAARSAADAIDRVVAARPDVVILDRLLPQPEHSQEVLAHVREHLPGAAILLVSGMPDDHLAGEARDAGADGHVSKAANAQALTEAVLRVAARRGDHSAARDGDADQLGGETDSAGSPGSGAGASPSNDAGGAGE
jgi:DNA-binding NarL/FixJ family response regulator